MSYPSISCCICLMEFNPKDSPFDKFLPKDICPHFIKSICAQCADLWLKENLKTIKLRFNNSPDFPLETYVKCPIQGCLKGLNFEAPSKYLDLSKLPATDGQLFFNYCRQTYDIVSCPVQSCRNKGFLSDPFCKGEIVCEACNFKWKESTSIGSMRVLRSFSNTKSEIFKYFFTKNCPTCKSPIQKIGGCNIMTCMKCGCHFCWMCLQQYSKHSISCHMKILGKSALIFAPVLYAFRKYGFFKFCDSIESIKKPLNRSWKEMYPYSVKLLGQYSRIFLYYSFLGAIVFSFFSAKDLIRQSIFIKRLQNEMSKKQIIALSILQQQALKKQLIYSTSAIVAFGGLTYLFGNKTELKVFTGIASLGISLFLSVFFAQMI